MIYGSLIKINIFIIYLCTIKLFAFDSLIVEEKDAPPFRCQKQLREIGNKFRFVEKYYALVQYNEKLNKFEKSLLDDTFIVNDSEIKKELDILNKYDLFFTNKHPLKGYLNELPKYINVESIFTELLTKERNKLNEMLNSIKPIKSLSNKIIMDYCHFKNVFSLDEQIKYDHYNEICSIGSHLDWQIKKKLSSIRECFFIDLIATNNYSTCIGYYENGVIPWSELERVFNEGYNDFIEDISNWIYHRNNYCSNRIYEISKLIGEAINPIHFSLITEPRRQAIPFVGIYNNMYNGDYGSIKIKHVNSNSAYSYSHRYGGNFHFINLVHNHKQILDLIEFSNIEDVYLETISTYSTKNKEFSKEGLFGFWSPPDKLEKEWNETFDKLIKIGNLCGFIIKGEINSYDEYVCGKDTSEFIKARSNINASFRLLETAGLNYSFGDISSFILNVKTAQLFLRNTEFIINDSGNIRINEDKIYKDFKINNCPELSLVPPEIIFIFKTLLIEQDPLKQNKLLSLYKDFCRSDTQNGFFDDPHFLNEFLSIYPQNYGTIDLNDNPLEGYQYKTQDKKFIDNLKKIANKFDSDEMKNDLKLIYAGRSLIIHADTVNSKGAKNESYALYEIASSLAEYGMGFYPPTALSQNIYELLFNESIITHESISKFDQMLNVMGIIFTVNTVGSSNFIVNFIKQFIKKSGQSTFAVENSLILYEKISLLAEKIGLKQNSELFNFTIISKQILGADVNGINKLSKIINLSKDVKPKLGEKYVRHLPNLDGSFREAFDGFIFKGHYNPGEIVFQAQRSGQTKPGRWFLPIKPINSEHAESLANINKWGNYAENIKIFKIKEKVSGYAGKIAGGEGHQFFIPHDIPLEDVIEEIVL